MEFLEALDRSPGGESLQVRYDSPDGYYGLKPDRFKDMLSDLLLDGCLNGPASMPWGASYAHSEVDYSGHQAFNDLFEGKQFNVRINHKGRLRLWRLRDELFNHRLKDKFGILIDQRYWERDLYVQMLGVTKERPLVLIQCDLDHFKAVNDVLGHDVGDAAIKAYFRLADEILGAHGDVYCRGGDEVLAVLSETDFELAKVLGEDLRGRVFDEFAEADEFKTTSAKPLTVSVGVAGYEVRVEPLRASDFVDGLQRRAKESGRNRVECALFAARAE